MAAIQFERTHFQPFRATTKIHLGKFETDIFKDDVFEFDGHTVRYAGMEYAVPQLRGLVGDWFVPAKDRFTVYKAKPAGVEVSHATPEAREKGMTFSMEDASEEEAVVGSVGEQEEIRKAANAGNTDRLAELRAGRSARQRGVTEEAGVDLPEVEVVGEDPPTEIVYKKAVPVHGASVESSQDSAGELEALERANRVNMQRIAALREKLDQTDPPKTRDQMGGTRHDSLGSGRAVAGGKYEVQGEDDAGVVVSKTYKFSDGATVGEEGVSGRAKATDVTRVAASQPVQVGRPVASAVNRQAGAEFLDEEDVPTPRRKTHVSAQDNTSIDAVLPNGGTGDVDEATTGDDLDELLPDAAVAGPGRSKKAIPTLAVSEEDEIQEILAGWNIKRHWQKRVQEAVQFYGAWPEALEAIYSVEAPAVVENIKKRLAQR